MIAGKHLTLAKEGNIPAIKFQKLFQWFALLTKMIQKMFVAYQHSTTYWILFSECLNCLKDWQSHYNRWTTSSSEWPNLTSASSRNTSVEKDEFGRSLALETIMLLPKLQVNTSIKSLIWVTQIKTITTSVFATGPMGYPPTAKLFNMQQCDWNSAHFMSHEQVSFISQQTAFAKKNCFA